MPRIESKFRVQRRSKKNKSFIITLNPASGLPPEICQQWQRRSFAFFPVELSAYRAPTTREAAALRFAKHEERKALVELLKSGKSHDEIIKELEAE